jgi:hypothetical protein
MEIVYNPQSISELLKEKLSDRRNYINRLILLDRERENIIYKFDSEYKKILKSITSPEGKYNRWNLRTKINESTKMRKYQREMLENKSSRKDIHKSLRSLKINLQMLSISNSSRII